MKKWIIINVVLLIIAGGLVGAKHINDSMHKTFEANVSTYVSELEAETVKVTLDGATILEICNKDLFDFDVLDTASVKVSDFSEIVNWTRKDNCLSNFDVLLTSGSAISVSKASLNKLPEENFWELDWEEVIPEVNLNQEAITPSCEISIKDYMENLDYSNKNRRFEKTYNKLLKLKNWTVEYENGTKLDWDYISKYVKVKKGRLEVKDPDFTAFVDLIADEYNTVGKEHKIGKIKVSGGTYGWEVDKDLEKSFLNKVFKSHKSKTERVPEFSHVAHSGILGIKDVGDTYTLVDIENQHVTYFENGEIKLEADCVTGHKNRHDTPTGVYFISEIKPKGKYLIGDDYKTWVDRWIRLTNSGIGLHDAKWRGSFGSDIYTRNGSHGCVNLPFSFVDSLIDEVEYGCPVVIM